MSHLEGDSSKNDNFVFELNLFPLVEKLVPLLVSSPFRISKLLALGVLSLLVYIICDLVQNTCNFR